MRTARTVSDPDVARHADGVLTSITLISVRPDLIGAAVEVRPLSLRSLDAIHLATALSLQPELAGMIVYDRRLAGAARAAGLTVWAPA